MNIDWVIPCRFVEVHDNLGTIVGAGIDTFWFQELPARVQLMLAIRLLGMVDDFDPEVQHAFKTQIRDPEGDVLNEAGGGVAIRGRSARPDFLLGITVPAVVVFDAAGEGTYTVELSVDDATKSLPIHIVHGLPPGHPVAESE